VFTWLESTSYAEWIQVSLWGWAIMLVLHAVGTATIVGINFVAALRLVGFFRPIPVTALSTLINISWVALALNLFTGFSLFMSNATNYMADMTFIAKMLLVIIASLATWQLQKALKQNGEAWDSAGAISATGLRLAMASLVLYSFTVVVARLIAYL
jgi:hypothetical protein